MRSYVLRRTVEAITAKGLQAIEYCEHTEVDGKRMSGGLLRR